jgi:hypothetical protein
MDIFKCHGPFSEYERFDVMLEKVAAAFQEISEEEKSLIQNFRNDLIQPFKNDRKIQ